MKQKTDSTLKPYHEESYNSFNKTGAVIGLRGPSQLADAGSNNHRRKISLDPRFLASATPQQMITLKDNLV